MSVPPKPIRIVIVDDHAEFRDSLGRLLALEADFEVVASLAGGEQALDWLRRETPDVLLLDLRMPDLDGLRVIERLGAGQCAARVVLLTGAREQAEYVEAIGGGAAAVLLKQTAPERLVECIRAVHAGELWVDEDALPLPSINPS